MSTGLTRASASSTPAASAARRFARWANTEEGRAAIDEVAGTIHFAPFGPAVGGAAAALACAHRGRER